MCYNNRETSHPPFFFHMFLHLYSWHCGMVACYLSCSRLAALSEADTRACGLAVRGMQQAIKQAQRPFNNVLGLVRGKRFASSPSLFSRYWFLYFFCWAFSCFFHAIVLLQFYRQLTAALQWRFTFLLITRWLTMFISVNQGKMEPFVCISCSGKCCSESQPEPTVGACSQEGMWWGAVQRRLAGLFHFGQSLFLTHVFFSNLCSSQDRVDSWWVAANAAYRLAVFCSDTAPKDREFSVHHKHCQANCSHQRECSAGGIS